MKLSELLFEEERAVSPVIGVIMMVAITVIMAAVIGAFVFGLAGQQQQIPQASLDFEFTDGSVTVVHNGGDALMQDTIGVTVGGTQLGASALSGAGSDNRYTAGEVIYTGSVNSGDEIRIIWKSPADDTTTTLGSATAP